MTSQQKASDFRVGEMVCPSEREAVMGLLDMIGAVEACACGALAAWAEMCKDPALRGGLRMIAEREAYHGRVFARRLAELGGEPTAVVRDIDREIEDYLRDPKVSDDDKVERLYQYSPDPVAIVQPVLDFLNALTEDTETKEILRLYHLDEISSGTWLCAYRDRLQHGARIAAE